MVGPRPLDRGATSSGCTCWSATGSCSPTSPSPTSCSGCRPATTASSRSPTPGRRSAATLFYRDFVGQEIKPEWRQQVTEAFETAQIVDTAAPDWYEETPTRVRAVPVLRRLQRRAAPQTTEHPIAVHHPAHQPERGAHPEPPGAHLQRVRQRPVRDDRLGRLPRPRRADRPAPRRPARIRRPDPARRRRHRHLRQPERPLGVQPHGLRRRARGRVARRGHHRAAAPASSIVDESLPLVVTGRAPWRTDIEARGVTVSLRAIPIRDHGERVGAIVLVPRRHRGAAPGAGAHHQGRDDPRDPPPGQEQPADGGVAAAHPGPAHALRRGAGCPHPGHAPGRARSPSCTTPSARASARTSTSTTSSTACCMLIAEVASQPQHDGAPEVDRAASAMLPSEYATPLALALTELVTNAVEHGLAGREGEVEIIAERTEETLTRAGARQRRRAARGQGRLGPRHADRAHAHPGRTGRHDRLAHARWARAPR